MNVDRYIYISLFHFARNYLRKTKDKPLSVYNDILKRTFVRNQLTFKHDALYSASQRQMVE